MAAASQLFRHCYCERKKNKEERRLLPEEENPLSNLWRETSQTPNFENAEKEGRKIQTWQYAVLKEEEEYL